MMQLPDYDNRFVLDITFGAWLILVGILVFVVYFAVDFVDVYDAGCTAYECGSVGIELATIVLFAAASCWFVHLSYPVQFNEDLGRIMDFAACENIEKQKSFGDRYLWGTNMLLLMWLFLLATLPFLAIPIWAYLDGDLSPSAFLIYFFALVFVILLLMFWLVAAFPESMLMNKMRGSSYFYDACLACCLGPLYDPKTDDFSAKADTFAGFIQRHLGGDFLLGAWFFFVAAIAQLAYTVYDVCVDYLDPLAYALVIGSLLLAIGSGLFVYTTYPENAFSRYWWCLSTCQSTEAEAGKGRGGGQEDASDLGRETQKLL